MRIPARNAAPAAAEDIASVIPRLTSGSAGRAVARKAANGALSKPPTIERNASTQAGMSIAAPGRRLTGVLACPKNTTKMSRNVYRDVRTTPAIPTPHSPALPALELAALHKIRSLL